MTTDWAKSVQTTFVTTASVHNKQVEQTPGKPPLQPVSCSFSMRWKHRMSKPWAGRNFANGNARFGFGRHKAIAVIPGTAASAGSA